MKREILFRGFNPKNNKWIYGYYLKNRGEAFITNDDKCFTDPNITWEDFLVKEDTIGQYTGLTDINGQKIFEGDIVQIWNGEQAVVEWQQDRAMFHTAPSILDVTRYYANELDSQVIGNIHDSP